MEEEKGVKGKLFDALRWILVLPGAVVCSYLFYLLFYFFNKHTPYISTEGYLGYIILFASHAVMGASFVTVGTLIAPSWRRTCAVCLFGIVCMIVGVAIFANIITNPLWVNIVCAICILGGAGYGLSYCFEKEIN